MTAEAEIRRRIAAYGRLTFAEFMDVALYHSVGGYYTSGERVGASGDYYTSPSAHPAFGGLLAVQLFQMWQLMGRPLPFTIIEAGAGGGILCRDILAAASELPAPFRECLRYVCIDRRSTPGLESKLEGASRIASAGVPLRGVVGCLLSNELLDAMPVHQVTVEGGRLKEVYVVSQSGELALRADEPSTPLLEQRFSDLGVQLREGQVAEVNLAMEGWMKGAAESLDRGLVLIIDYGRRAGDLYSPADRFRGTLTTYRDHLQTDRPLERVGQQDISAQVDFTTAVRAAKVAGLDVLGDASQARFLGNLGIGYLMERVAGGAGRRHSSRMAMQALIKTGGLGAFRVMALGRNVGQPGLWGFMRADEPARLVERLPVPELTPEHVNLATGRYPWQGMEFDVPWGALWPAEETAE